jgi:hypothetical protein
MAKLEITDAQKSQVIDALDIALDQAFADGVTAPSTPDVLDPMPRYSSMSPADKQAVRDIFRQVLAANLVTATGGAEGGFLAGFGTSTHIALWNGSHLLGNSGLTWTSSISQLNLASGGLAFYDGTTQSTAGVSQADLDSQLTAYPTLSYLASTYVSNASLASTLSTYPSGTATAGQVTFWAGSEVVAGDTKLTWDNVNKRLGIGTTSPNKPLHVAASISSDTVATFQNTATDGIAGISFANALGTTMLSIGASDSASTYFPGLNTISIGADLVFAAASTEKVRIKTTGKVLIGTPTDDGAASKLQVNGKITSNSGGFGFPDGTSQPSASSVVILTVACQTTDSVGDLISPILAGGGARTVQKADMTNMAGVPAIGVIISKPTTTTAMIQVGGAVEGIYSGLTPGVRYFVGSDGRPTSSFPIPGYAVGTDYFLQHIGVALDTASLLLMPNPQLTLLTA